MDKEYILRDIYRNFGTADESTEAKDEKVRLRLAKAAKKNLKEKQALIAEISEILEGYAVVDWEDPEACCYEFKVLLHKGQDLLDDDVKLIEALGNTRYDLNVFVSIIGPYYLSYVDRTKHRGDEWDFLILDQYSEEIKNAVRKLDERFKDKGYEIIPLDMARTVIPNVESRYKGFGDFTFFNGLFTDLYDIQAHKWEAPLGIAEADYQQSLLSLYYLLWRYGGAHEGQEEPCPSDIDSIFGSIITDWGSNPADPDYRKPWLDLLDHYRTPEKMSREELLIVIKAFIKKYEVELKRRFCGATEKIHALSPDDPVLYEAIQRACKTTTQLEGISN
jgi:hypothetical protein